MSPVLRHVRDMAREHAEAAFAVVVSIARDPNHPKQHDAAQSILDRAWGKPTQAIANDTESGAFIIQVVKHSDRSDPG